MHVHLVFISQYRREVFTKEILADLRSIFAGVWDNFEADDVRIPFRAVEGLSILIRVGAWIRASLLTVLAFQVMYNLCPDLQRRKWHWFTPGALIALLGWVAGSIGLRVYLHFFNSYSVTYGSLGAVVILLLWFYLTGVMILFGGEVNSEIEHAVAERQLKTGKSPLPPQSAINKIAI